VCQGATHGIKALHVLYVLVSAQTKLWRELLRSGGGGGGGACWG